MNTHNLFILFVLITIFFSCSKNSDGDTEKEKGYAMEKVDGHSFQFYSNKKVIFSIFKSHDDIKVLLGKGKALYKDPIFTYEKTGDNTASCLIFISFSYTVGENTIYDAYSSSTKLFFNSPNSGTYQNYDIETNKAGSSGLFTVDDDDDLDFTETPDTPDQPDQPDQPDTPTIPQDAIISKITSLIEGTTEDQFRVEHIYNSSIVKKIQGAGYCWDTNPHPTVLNSTMKINLSANNNAGYTYCHVKHNPGTTYYFRAFVQVGNKFVYFNEMEMETLGGKIKLTTNYSTKDDKIYIDYDINKSGTFELLFEWCTDKYRNQSLGFVSKGKGQKSVGGHFHDLEYRTILKDTSTGMIYYSKRIN